MNRKTKNELPFMEGDSSAVRSQGQKKRNYPYRSSYHKKDNSANKRLWMMLYGEPKRKPVPESQGTSWKQGELFK